MYGLFLLKGHDARVAIFVHESGHKPVLYISDVVFVILFLFDVVQIENDERCCGWFVVYKSSFD